MCFVQTQRMCDKVCWLFWLVPARYFCLFEVPHVEHIVHCLYHLFWIKKHTVYHCEMINANAFELIIWILFIKSIKQCSVNRYDSFEYQIQCVHDLSSYLVSFKLYVNIKTSYSYCLCLVNCGTTWQYIMWTQLSTFGLGYFPWFRLGPNTVAPVIGKVEHYSNSFR